MQSFPYDRGYFENYLGLDSTECGRKLTQARVDLVRKHWQGEVLDVGVGGGRFVCEIDGYGFDVNEQAVAWLIRSGRYLSPYSTSVECVTFWDSLEHIEDPADALALVGKWAFISMPIYQDCAHVLRSKHFKPEEHFWYFTRRGLIEFMNMQGFKIVEQTTTEQAFGREDIESFAFRREFPR